MPDLYVLEYGGIYQSVTNIPFLKISFFIYISEGLSIE